VRLHSQKMLNEIKLNIVELQDNSITPKGVDHNGIKSQISLNNEQIKTHSEVNIF